MSTGLQRALWLPEPVLFPSVLRMEKRGQHILSFCPCPTLMAAGAAGGLCVPLPVPEDSGSFTLQRKKRKKVPLVAAMGAPCCSARRPAVSR